MLPAAATRVLDRASRGEELSRAAAAESVDLHAGGELDACHDGKPVCTVRPRAFLGGAPVFAETNEAPAPVLASRRQSLARSLNRTVIFLGPSSWSMANP